MKENLKYHSERNQPDHLTEVEFAIYAEFLRKERADLPEELRVHVEECTYCRHELMAITDLMDEVDRVEESGDLIKGKTSPIPIFRRILPVVRIAAALAAVILLSWIIQMVIRKPDSNQMAKVEPTDSIIKSVKPILDNETASKVDSTGFAAGDPIQLDKDVNQQDGKTAQIAIPDTVRYAQAFIPNPSYEAMVGGKFRAAKNPQVTCLDADGIMAPDDTLRLAWVPDPRDSYTLIIVDNKGIEVRSVEAGSGSGLAWKSDLAPGLYYWKFTGIEELWKVGRITVRNEN